MVDRYPLEAAANAIIRCGLRRIVLQFPDEELPHCAAVYEYFQKRLNEADDSTKAAQDALKAPEADIYITADSTWGSSIDDVSAMHCDAEVLLYFGSDLSSSGTIPVMVIPPRQVVNIEDCVRQLKYAIQQSKHAIQEPPRCCIFFAAGCAEAVQQISSASLLAEVQIAQLPALADLHNWEPRLRGASASTAEAAGGLLIPAAAPGRKPLNEDEEQLIVYIGDKEEQLTNIMLRFSGHTVLHYSLGSASAAEVGALHTIRGCDSRAFRERYGGVMRVRDASIVGIIIGSMGLTEDLTRDVMHRLQSLIAAARKQHYTFVMGRLNEAKLCNFPEVGVFCLVSNDDIANIKPKTFPVPVLTPFELELGLGARDWQSSYSTDLDSLVRGGEAALSAAVEKVKAAFAEEWADASDDLDVENCNNSSGGSSDILLLLQPSVLDDHTSVNANESTTALVTAGIEKQQVTVFNSAAADFFRSRDFQGLERRAPAGHSTEVRTGQFGIAADYAPMSTAAATTTTTTTTTEEEAAAETATSLSAAGQCSCQQASESQS